MNLHQILKEETTVQHHRLEEALGLMRSDFTLEDYRHILEKFFGFYQPLEEKFSETPERKKTPRLLNDLAFLKLDYHKLPSAQELPSMGTPSEVWGVRYVLEGSTLGGMVLTKHYKEKFNLTEDQGISFFSGYGPKTMSLWKAFLEELNAFGESSECETKLVLQGAKSTFTTLHHWLLH